MEKRACEEQDIVRAEMQSTLDWYNFHHELMLTAMYMYTTGQKAHIVKEGLYVEMMLNSLCQAF